MKSSKTRHIKNSYNYKSVKNNSLIIIKAQFKNNSYIVVKKMNYLKV